MKTLCVVFFAVVSVVYLCPGTQANITETTGSCPEVTHPCSRVSCKYQCRREGFQSGFCKSTIVTCNVNLSVKQEKCVCTGTSEKTGEKAVDTTSSAPESDKSGAENSLSSAWGPCPLSLRCSSVSCKYQCRRKGFQSGFCKSTIVTCNVDLSVKQEKCVCTGTSEKTGEKAVDTTSSAPESDKSGAENSLSSAWCPCPLSLRCSRIYCKLQCMRKGFEGGLCDSANMRCSANISEKENQCKCMGKPQSTIDASTTISSPATLSPSNSSIAASQIITVQSTAFTTLAPTPAVTTIDIERTLTQEAVTFTTIQPSSTGILTASTAIDKLSTSTSVVFSSAVTGTPTESNG